MFINNSWCKIRVPVKHIYATLVIVFLKYSVHLVCLFVLILIKTISWEIAFRHLTQAMVSLIFQLNYLLVCGSTYSSSIVIIVHIDGNWGLKHKRNDSVSKLWFCKRTLGQRKESLTWFICLFWKREPCFLICMINGSWSNFCFGRTRWSKLPFSYFLHFQPSWLTLFDLLILPYPNAALKRKIWRSLFSICWFCHTPTWFHLWKECVNTF